MEDLRRPYYLYAVGGSWCCPLPKRGVTFQDVRGSVLKLELGLQMFTQYRIKIISRTFIWISNMMLVIM